MNNCQVKNPVQEKLTPDAQVRNKAQTFAPRAVFHPNYRKFQLRY